MNRYRRTLQIASIRIKVEGIIPFEISERCRVFEKENCENDAIFRITEAKELDAKGYETVYEAVNFRILTKGKEILKVQYTDKRKENINWYLRYNLYNPNQYQVSICKSAKSVLRAFNPLQFLDLSEFLIQYSAVIVHGSVVDYRGGIVFTAPSGTGKSTQAALWEKYYGATVINGDRAIIRRESDYQVYGSPYAGSSRIYKNENTKLSAVVVLRQAKENKIKRMSKKETYLCLISEMSVSRWNKKTVEQQTEWMLQMIDEVPVYMLECLPNKDAADMLYRELGGLSDGTR